MASLWIPQEPEKLEGECIQREKQIKDANAVLSLPLKLTRSVLWT